MASRFEDEEPAGMPPVEFPPEATSSRPKVVQLQSKEQPKEPWPSPLAWPDLAGKEPPARKWAINGWIGYGHTTLLVGSGGIGKTLLSQQIGSCLSLGRSFIDEITHPQKVLMWACEDDHDELWRRQVNIARSQKVGLEEFAGHFRLVPRHGYNNTMCFSNFGKLEFSPLITELAKEADEFEADVVILDNVAQLYGAGENDRHSVTAFLNYLSGQLKHRALLLLAHPSRAQGSEFSGSGAWENVARTRLYLGSKLPDAQPDPDVPDNPDERYLSRRKANYSSKDWRRFQYDLGVLVPEAVESQGTGLIGHLREQAAERLVVEAIRKLESMGIHATEGQRSPQYLPRLIIEYKLGNGHSKPELATAMRKLMTDGKLTKTIVGKNANRSDKLGLSVADQETAP